MLKSSNTLRRVALFFLVLLLGLWFVPPLLLETEHRDLDDEARTAAPGKFVDLSHGKVHYEIAGPENGPVVLLVHGFHGASFIWEPLYERLPNFGFRTVRFDHYGRGYSDRPDVDYDRVLYEETLRDLLDALAKSGEIVDEPAHVVGLSMGGPATACFAERFPEKVRSLVFIDPLVGPVDPGPVKYPVLGEYLATLFYAPDLPTSQNEGLYNKKPPHALPDFESLYQEQMSFHGFKRSLLRSLRQFMSEDFTGVYAAVGEQKKPTLVVWGRRDETIPLSESERIVDPLGAELVVIEEAAHTPHLEKPDEVAEILRDFLAESVEPPERTIRVGLLADLPTPGGPATKKTAEFIGEEIQRQGGLKVGDERFGIEWIFGDTENDPPTSARAAQNLIDQGVVALVGPNISRNAIPAAGVAQAAGIPMISPGSTHPDTTDGRPFVFRAAFVETFQGLALARFLLEELDEKRASILYDADDVSATKMAEVFRVALEFEGGDVVEEIGYPEETTDFAAHLQELRLAEIDALLLPNVTDDVVEQVRLIREIRPDLTLLGSDLFSVFALAARPDVTEGMYFSNHWHSQMGDEASARFAVEYRARFGEEPLTMSALTYDAAGLLFSAIRNAGETDPEAIRRVLAEKKDYQGLTGSISYEGTEGDPYKNVVILTVRDGEVVPDRVIEPMVFDE